MHQFAYGKRLVTCGALLDFVLVEQRKFDCGREIALIQLDFSAAFDIVSHVDLMYKLQNAGNGGPILKVFRNFLFCRSQRVEVDGAMRYVVDVVMVILRVVFGTTILFVVYC